MKDKILQVIEKDIRPNLHLHGGDVEILGFDEEEKLLRLKLLGQCCVCPSSIDTIENLIKHNLMVKIKDLKEIIVETGLSNEMIEIAKKYLSIKSYV